MSLKRGDVVIVRFPFSSGTGAKLRPALVVQNDVNNVRLTNAIVAAITTTTHRNNQPTQLLVIRNTAVGVQSGLAHDSVVTRENLATVDRSLIRGKIGILPRDVMAEIDVCLKSALGIT